MTTIRDIAKHSGYSIATVSAVINNEPIVSEKAKTKIEQAIEELGYTPNYIARSLKSKSTFTIGIMIKDINNPLYPEMVSAIESVLWERNYSVYLCVTHDNEEREKHYLNNLIGNKVDGVIIATSKIDSDISYKELNKNGIPYIFVNRKPKNMQDDELYIGGDNVKSVKVAIKYIKQLGYESVGYISGTTNYSTYRDRYNSFIKSMEEADLEINPNYIYITAENYTEASGYKYVSNLIENGQLPDVILSASDYISFGVYMALRERGLSLPEDISLVSIDNTQFASYLGLTSVDMKIEKVGQKAAEMLLREIKQKESKCREENDQVILNPTLVVRNSSN